MLIFKPVTGADRAVIERYTRGTTLQNCDYAFANMVCWQGVYRSEWTEAAGFLVIRFRINGGDEVGYMQPIGSGDFTTLLPLLTEDAHRIGQPLRLVGLTDEAWQQLQETAPERFAAEADRNLCDYIYRREDLVTLRGRHYQPKRNHLNRFRSSYPDYRYEPLTARHAAACMGLSGEWCRQHGGCQDAALSAEQAAMQCAFDHFEELGLQGGALYVGEQLVAFSYGSVVGDETFVVHVEKADTRYEGAFTMINRLLAEQVGAAIRWINREEDLGIEGLRKAKLSYCPTLLLRKWMAVEQSDEAQRCRQLWQLCFPSDERTFIDHFLLHYYRRERMLTQEREGKMVAMAHLLDFASDEGRMSYLFGVATDPEWRGKGLATVLIEEAKKRAAAAGNWAVVLIAASPSLRSFYAERGFRGEVPIRLLAPDHFDFGTGDAAADRAMLAPCTAHNAEEPLPEELIGYYTNL